MPLWTLPGVQCPGSCPGVGDGHMHRTAHCSWVCGWGWPGGQVQGLWHAEGDGDAFTAALAPESQSWICPPSAMRAWQHQPTRSWVLS